ncbi:MAG: hypothetical protein C4527_11885 [Candidatus Omnitrophota bacterium]|nr:MAG: hypothetical protein C4527_11885 [Candidatus Omnitrophota bacterium]
MEKGEPLCFAETPNGFDLTASEKEVVETFLRLAGGEISFSIFYNSKNNPGAYRRMAKSL